MGTCYIGVAGPGTDDGECRDSIENLDKRPGDSVHYGRGTKGYEVRQLHVNRFIASGHEWLLLLDHDMVYAPDTLTRLLSHNQAYVSGYYLQRRYSPLVPVWFRPGDTWPLEPFLEIPESGKLHELGASGWGCILIHREVIEGTRTKVLKGEWDIIEDDMDIWPYDLNVVMAALSAGDIETLRREIRLYRGRYDGQQVGSDIRYPLLARAAGYTLWGDPDVTPGHMVSYPLMASDYRAQSAAAYVELVRGLGQGWANGHALWQTEQAALKGGGTSEMFS